MTTIAPPSRAPTSSTALPTNSLSLVSFMFVPFPAHPDARMPRRDRPCGGGCVGWYPVWSGVALGPAGRRGGGAELSGGRQHPEVGDDQRREIAQHRLQPDDRSC